MTAETNHLTEIDEAARREFEADWIGGVPRPLAAYLPEEDDPRRLATLKELVYIDLEFSWKRGSAAGGADPTRRIEDYLAQFPELSHDGTLERLCLQEFEVRHRFGDRPGADEYFHRFPSLSARGGELRAQMDGIASVAEAERSAVDRTQAFPGQDAGLTAGGADVAAATISGAQRGFVTLHGFLDAKRAGQTSPLAVEEKLAQGGMGAVLVCRDPALQRRVAVKVMKPEIAASEEHRARFLEEAQVTGQLEHPNIVPIHDLGKDAEGNLYFSMKLVQGRSLGQVLAELKEHGGRGRSLAELLDILLKVADGLAFAHSKGVVHRDLKPDNVMVGDFGEVLIMDWGLAKLLGRKAGDASDGDSSGAADPQPDTAKAAGGGTIQSVRADSGTAPTLDGTVQGTPAYMPPEQATGNIDLIDHRSDIYSLGAILYEILTLQRPFVGKSVLDLLARVAEGDVVPPERRAPDRSIPKELSAVAMKAMRTAREDRYQTVQELAQDIRLFLEGRAVSAKEDTLFESLVKLVRRNQAVSTAIAVAAVIIVVLSAVSYVRIRGERDVARANERTATRNWNLAQEKERQARENERRAVASEQQAVEAKRRQWESALAASKQFALQTVELANVNRLEQAQRRAHDAAIVAPDGPWQFFATAAIAMAEQKYSEAAELYRTALSKPDGDQPEIRAALADVLARQGQLQEAESVLAQLDNIGDWRILLSAGRALYAAHNWDACQKPLARAIELMTAEKDRPQASLVEAQRLLEAAPAQKACEGFYDEIRNLPFDELARRVQDKMIEIHGGKHPRDFRTQLFRDAYGTVSFAANGARCELPHLYPLRGLPIQEMWLGGPDIWDLSPLKGMPLKKLALGGCTGISDLEPLTYTKTLLELDLARTGVTDLSPLRDLKLKQLSCPEGTEDLSPLSGLPLERLSLEHARKIDDLTPLHGMPLKQLNVSETRVSDLSPLAGMPLRSLNVIGCGRIKSLAPLQGMRLEELNVINSGQINDLSPLAGMPLRKVILNSGVTDLSPLAGAPLEVLSIPSAPIADLSPIAGSPLTTLDMCRTEVTDLTPLLDSPVQSLDLRWCLIEDYSPLASMKNLEPAKHPWLPYLLGKQTERQLLEALQSHKADSNAATGDALMFTAMKKYAEGDLPSAAKAMEQFVSTSSSGGEIWIAKKWLERFRKEQAERSGRPAE